MSRNQDLPTRRIGWTAGIALLLGAFLVLTAVFTQSYLLPRAKKAPLGIDSTAYLEGTATLDGPEGAQTIPIRATTYTTSDTDLSDDTAVVVHDAACIVKAEVVSPECVPVDDPALIDASETVYAADRSTGEGIDDPAYVKGEVQTMSGQTIKWPFDAKKRDYQVWDSTVGELVPAAFEGEEEIDGLETYRYQVEVSEVPVELTDGVDGFYAGATTYWVDPTTGAVIDVETRNNRTFEDGSTFADIQLSYVDKTIARNVKDAKTDKRTLHLASKVVPLVGYGVGALLLLLGGLLALARGRRRHGAHAETEQPQAVIAAR